VHFSVDLQTPKQVTGGPLHKTSKRIHMQIMCAFFVPTLPIRLSHLIIWHEEFQYNAGGRVHLQLKSAISIHAAQKFTTTIRI
jgi:hypothetical protein